MYKSKSLELKLITTKKDALLTEGVLFNIKTNTKLCDTLEDTIRDVNGNGVFDGDEKKIYGTTAIPGGKYKIRKRWSPKFKMYVIEICDVPEFTDIYFHWLRTVDNSLGCVGCGKRVGYNNLENIGMTQKLVSLFDRNGNNGYVIIER